MKGHILTKGFTDRLEGQLCIKRPNVDPDLEVEN